MDDASPQPTPPSSAAPSPPESSPASPARVLSMPFFNAAERRLRAGVRILLHLLAIGLGGALIQFGVRAIAGRYGLAIGSSLTLGWIVLATWMASRWLDRRAFLDLGTRMDRPRALDLAVGTLIGGGAIALVALLEAATGSCSFAVQLAPDWPRVGVVAVWFVAVAVQEELIFRGYQLVNGGEGLSRSGSSARTKALIAVLVSSIGFGLAHIANPSATWLSSLNIAFGGGVLLAVGLVFTGELALSVGIHFGWNLTQALCDMPVSGLDLEGAPLCTRVCSAAPVLTGADFGPEGGILGLLAMLAGTAAALGYVRLAYGSLEVRARFRKDARPDQS